MAMRPPFPGHTLKATFDDIRRDLEGLIVRDVTGRTRAGVFPDHTDELFVRQNSMRLGVKPFRAAQVRSGVVLLANDGVELVTLAAAPSANRRIDLVYVTARSTAAPWGDTADTPTFGVIQGVASATPVVPSLPPAFADALPLFTVEIAAGTTTTQAAGVIVTQVFPYTAAAGGVVLVRNPVELAAWKPADGGRAFSLSDSSSYLRLGGGWHGGSSILAQGNSYMNAGTQWGLSEKVSEQQFGIAVVWSAYSAAGATNQWSVDFIPKAALAIVGSGSGWVFKPGLNAGITKYLYVSDTQVSGYDPNGSAPNNQVALRYVIGV